jgi:DNA-binding Lrp family transcriptional regulator
MKIDLDDLDRALLSALDFGPRTGLKVLSEQINRSQQVIDYRIRSLQKQGLLAGFYPVIDAFRLGYRYCRLFIQLTDLSPTQIRMIKTFAQKHPEVLWCYRMEGDFNLVLVFWTKSLREFESLTTNFLSLIGAQLLTYNQNQVFALEHLPVAQVLLRSPQDPLSISESTEILDIDALDCAILRKLSSDARASFSSLAQKCKTSDKVISYRIQRLEERGIIRGYRPLLNWSVAGLLFFKIFIRLDYSKGDILQAFYSHLVSLPELLYIVRGVGAPGDIDIEVVVPGYSELYIFIDKLRKKFPGVIRSTSHYHFTDCLKVNYFPLR